MFVTYSLMHGQYKLVFHGPSKKEKRAACNDADSRLACARARFKSARRLITVGYLYPTQTDAHPHRDVIFKAYADVQVFLDHVIADNKIEEARQASQLRKPGNWIKWGQALQTKSQNDMLTAAFEYMNVFVRETRRLKAWKQATRAQRREALRFCFDEAPLRFTELLFHRLSRRVNIYQIWGVDAQKVPAVQKWRHFIKMVCVDVCDKAYMFAIRTKAKDHTERKHRFTLWRFMTHTRKYKALMLALGSRDDVPVYASGLYQVPRAIYGTVGEQKETKPKSNAKAASTTGAKAVLGAPKGKGRKRVHVSDDELEESEQPVIDHRKRRLVKGIRK